ncbi:NADPH-dependent assimilatory sulfite reductase hemoprotein subunit [Steroidobacter sp. S1-65]|uniref:NADPH-dependent assimilatory sulfite reductase hemoprotein subunit n=1 Tax=Steroidobacter gossypii TaxID=2805490 RepID=A0ABS1WYG1_9GAMM|nr:NADPH-dependent assimilatory sulfite reductase hemoprotein subunit [Steroidobacter gossypii]MBM0105977.1 NADPH-dependent assimilatory sulfite reductase hemoprotein subunit [Steroidobacter gossypii]
MDAIRKNDLSTPVEQLHSNEQLKLRSRFLRGTLEQSLAEPLTGSIAADDALLTKFFGVYQQDDRDLREERRVSRLEPLYSFMVRVRLPGGVCTARQWLALDAQARATANGQLRMTTRQTFQFHGVLKHNLAKHIQGIAAAGLDTIAACGDDNRNVICTANPLFSRAHAEATATARKLSEHLMPRTAAYRELLLQQPASSGLPENEEPLYGPTYLPRKFKIAIAVPPSNDVDIYAHDLGFVAIVENGEIVGYNVLVGGGMGMTHKVPTTFPRLSTLAGFCNAEEIVEVAEHTMCIQRDFGDRLDRAHARFKYTIEDRGIEWFKAELARRRGKPLEPARAFGFTTNGDRYGWHRGEDGRWHCTVFIRNGRIADSAEAPLMSTLRQIASELPVVFALTTNRNVTLAGVEDADRSRIDALLLAGGLAGLSSPAGLEQNAMACVALPTCGLAMAESERYLPSLLHKLEALVEAAGLADTPITIRMSGCPNGCSRPFLAEIGLVGKAPGKYNLYLGGSPRGERLNSLCRENIGEQQILDALRPLLNAYASERAGGEAFGDFLIRTGALSRAS